VKGAQLLGVEFNDKKFKKVWEKVKKEMEPTKILDEISKRIEEMFGNACSKCNNKIPSEDNFCSKCGEKIGRQNRKDYQ